MKTWITALAATAMLTSTAAYAADATFHPSTYTTYKKHAAYNGDVDVLHNAPGGNNYTEIGIVRVKSKTAGSFDVALNSLKKSAAEHGGTAIILQDDAEIYAEGGTTDKGTPPENVSAIAIRR